MTQVDTEFSLTIDRKTLAHAMTHLARVVEKRNTIPILSNVRLTAADDTLRLIATDLDIEACVEMACDISGQIDLTVPAALLNDITRKVPEGAAITLSKDLKGNAIVLKAGRARFTLQTLPATDFPEMLVTEMSHCFRLSASALEMMLECTGFAISTEETRYYLNGIYMHCVEQPAEELGEAQGEAQGRASLRAVATDGHRLARFDVEAPAGASGMPGIIIPRKTVGEMLRLAKESTDKAGNGDLEISLSTAKIRIANAHGVTLTSKLIDGTFPDYTRVIPRANDKRVVLDRMAFALAADRVATISSERGRAVKMSLGTDLIKLSVTNPDAGSAHEEIEAVYDGPDMDIGFNSRYLADVLGVIADRAETETDKDTILVKLADPGSPTLFQKREGDALLIVLMPMRV
jgi:DNA polymerase-3 subunit beta